MLIDMCRNMKIEKKATIRNRYNYLKLPIQTAKGKEGRFYSNGTTIKTVQTESQKDSFFPRNWPNSYPKYKFTRTYMQRHTMTEIVNHNRSNALKRSVETLWRWWWWWWGFNRFYVATTLALSSALVNTTQDICSVRVKVSLLISATSPRI